MLKKWNRFQFVLNVSDSLETLLDVSRDQSWQIAKTLLAECDLLTSRFDLIIGKVCSVAKCIKANSV